MIAQELLDAARVVEDLDEWELVQLDRDRGEDLAHELAVEAALEERHGWGD